MALALAKLEAPSLELMDNALALMADEIADEIDAQIAGNGCAFHFVCTTRDPLEVIGCIAVVTGENGVPYVGTFAKGYNLYVLPEYRSGRAAALLIDAAIEYARQCQVDVAYLTVDTKRGDVPEAAYRRLGFAPESALYVADMEKVKAYGLRRK